MLPFSKYEGTGNDFILIDDRKETFPTHRASFISQLCHRRFGIGADGLILLQPSIQCDARMRVFNANGSEAESCGNGLCCLMQFMTDLGFAQGVCQIETMQKKVEGYLTGEKVSITFGPPSFIDLPSELFLNGESVPVHLIDTGVPHIVSFVDDLEKIDVQKRGAEIRWHRSLEPRGANVNFAQRKRDGSIQVRTFERGVEMETLGCGTGAAAVALVSAKLFHNPSPVKVRFPGGDIEIHFQQEMDQIANVQMLGSANFIFSGHIRE